MHTVEFKAQPVEEGLHDSGYRFLQVRHSAVHKDEDDYLVTCTRQLNTHADNITVKVGERRVHIDCEPDGTFRLWVDGSTLDIEYARNSDAQFVAQET